MRHEFTRINEEQLGITYKPKFLFREYSCFFRVHSWLIFLFFFVVPFASAFTQADYEDHAAGLRQKAPAGFAVVIQSPFVVLGDEPGDTVRLRSERTIKWAVDLLKQDYFPKDPDSIIDIWLLKDNASYERYSKEIFKTDPPSPFGYYLDQERAMVMNIRTGAGTLVHEIVHPFLQTNFPACPVWLNEGLASLYEQCGERSGHIHGYTNWRLPALQTAIRKRQLPSFKKLCLMDEDEFYTRDRGTNYGQARYLCYYLQEQGLLLSYYRQLVDSQAVDPTGYKTLKIILGVEDMDDFKKTWEQFILTLTFP